MFRILLKLFVKDYENTKNPQVREKYGILSGAVGIVVNLLLTTGKFIIGMLSNSISITADALNNLSDAGSCIVTLFGFKMAGRKPDKQHPFGHGRIEYVAALIVGFIVEIMGIELIKSSVDKILHPQAIVFSIPAVCVLVLSILSKLWLALFNRYLGKKISSPALSAAVKDSIGDITATSLTLVSLIVAKFTGKSIDGILGIAVALLIMYSGYQILKESIGIILGNPPSAQLVDELVALMKNHKGVLDIHDLVIHSYGESRLFGSVHIELSDSTDLVTAHDIVNDIENEVLEKFSIQLVAHIDPVSANDENYEKLRLTVTEAVELADSSFSIHDFRIVAGSPKKLVFDLVIPFDCKLTADEVKKLVLEKCTETGIDDDISANVEYSYT
ncbi:MAG: cation diffusion facilitator family transporter [Acutalibacteraceae bacterium]